MKLLRNRKSGRSVDQFQLHEIASSEQNFEKSSFVFPFCVSSSVLCCKMSSESLVAVLRRLWDEYHARTPQKLKLVDAYLAYIMATGIVQFLYCLLVGTFPFNSFLSGFISCVGSFVLAGEQSF